MTENITTKKIDNLQDKSLLLVDDDNPFRERLARAMERKGFTVSQADGVKSGSIDLSSLLILRKINSSASLSL